MQDAVFGLWYILIRAKKWDNNKYCEIIKNKNEEYRVHEL